MCQVLKTIYYPFRVSSNHTDRELLWVLLQLTLGKSCGHPRMQAPWKQSLWVTPNITASAPTRVSCTCEAHLTFVKWMNDWDLLFQVKSANSTSHSTVHGRLLLFVVLLLFTVKYKQEPNLLKTLFLMFFSDLNILSPAQFRRKVIGRRLPLVYWFLKPVT